MLAGVLMAIKHHNPRIEVIGVEPVNFASCAYALENGGPIEVGE
jgi:threonine dehydratase